MPRPFIDGVSDLGPLPSGAAFNEAAEAANDFGGRCCMNIEHGVVAVDVIHFVISDKIWDRCLVAPLSMRRRRRPMILEVGVNKLLLFVYFCWRVAGGL